MGEPGKRSHVGCNSGGTVIIMRGRLGMITNLATYEVHGYIVHLVQVRVNFELHMCSYAGKDYSLGLSSALSLELCVTLLQKA